MFHRFQRLEEWHTQTLSQNWHNSKQWSYCVPLNFPGTQTLTGKVNEGTLKPPKFNKNINFKSSHTKRLLKLLKCSHKNHSILSNIEILGNGVLHRPFATHNLAQVFHMHLPHVFHAIRAVVMAPPRHLTVKVAQNISAFSTSKCFLKGMSLWQARQSKEIHGAWIGRPIHAVSYLPDFGTWIQCWYFIAWAPKCTLYI